MESVSGLHRVPGLKPQHQVVKQLAEKRDGVKDHVAEKTPRCKSLGPDADRRKTERCKTAVSSKRSKSLENTQKVPVSQNEKQPCAKSEPQHLESPAAHVGKSLAGQSPSGRAKPKRDFSPKGVLYCRQSSLNSICHATSTDSRSSTPELVKPKCKRRRDRQKAKKVNGKKKELRP
jgi:hypothetical protein